MSFDDDNITSEETPTTKPMTQSILLTIKKMLGIAEEYHAFDIDIVTNINAVFLTLNQLGVGPTMPFQITGDSETWNDFLKDQEAFMAGVQTYIYMRVRLMFDPPTNSFLVDSLRKQCDELEWRFMIQPKDSRWLDAIESWEIEHPSYNDSTSEKEDDENQNGSEDEEIEPVYPIPDPATPVVFTAKREKPKVVKNLLDIFS